LELPFALHELDAASLLSPTPARTKRPGRPTRLRTPASTPARTPLAEDAWPADVEDEHFLSMAQQVAYEAPSSLSRTRTPSNLCPSGASAASVLQTSEGGASDWVSGSSATPVKALSPRVRSKYQLAADAESVLNSAIRHVERLSLSPRAVRQLHGDVYRMLVACPPCD
jgi:hypothetical protein